MAATNYQTKIYNIHRAGEDVDLIRSASADGSTSATVFIGPVWYSVTGTLAGAKVKVQSLDPNSAYSDIAGTTTSAPCDKLIDFPPFASNTLKAIIASASSTTDIGIRLQGGLGRDIGD